jgi:hypothetical protein
MIGSGRLLNVRGSGNDALRIRGSYSLLSSPSLPARGKMRKEETVRMGILPLNALPYGPIVHHDSAT